VAAQRRVARRPALQAPLRGFAGGGTLARAQLLAAPLRWPEPERLAAGPPGATRRAQEALRKLGLESIGALLEHLPAGEESLRTLASLRVGERVSVAVEVERLLGRSRARAQGVAAVQAQVRDHTGSARAVFFNQPWLQQRLSAGTRLLLRGRVDARRRIAVWSHARIGAHELPRGATALYPAGGGLRGEALAGVLAACAGALCDVVERLPGRLRASFALPTRAEALAALHFCRGQEQRGERALRRLAFEELLLLQLRYLRRRNAARGLRARALCGPPGLAARWISEQLPFAPTAAQLEAVATIARDLQERSPMRRLLVGEVGSGKTVVALWAILRAAEHGHQAALMAPTETLAEQHARTVQTLLGDLPVAWALLSGSSRARERREILGALAAGELAFVIGTHALIEPEVRFASLALAVIDEQHRFGVRQRAQLGAKGPGAIVPHTLHLSATPIPRSLALVQFGDLDITLMRERPAARAPVRTCLVDAGSGRGRAYAALREQVRAGHQAFVVCPLVSASEQSGAQLRAAEKELEALSAGELAGLRIALLHGQMHPGERQRAMRDFAEHAIDVLVATTVIEVGIDVPNATVIVIENAERFGLAALHQLRGRVGRGSAQGWCFLVCARPGAAGARLRAMAKISDGFRLAELDLALRGRGELAGVRQSGAPELRFARLPQDRRTLLEARRCALQLLAADPELAAPEHALLADALRAPAGEGDRPVREGMLA